MNISTRNVLRGAVLASLAGAIGVGAVTAAEPITPAMAEQDETGQDATAQILAETPTRDDAADTDWDLRAEASLDASRDSSADSSRDSGRAALTDLTVTVDGAQTPVSTDAATVGEALAQAGIVVDGDDIVTPAVSTATEPGLEVTVKRVETSTVTDATPHGIDGEVRTTFRVTTVDGVETERVQIASSVVEGTLDVAVETGDTRAIGQAMAAERGWTGEQWTCLNSLWTRESNWTVTADNPTSSAYGIPQALPGSKMASHGSDWASNPVTQIAWGLDYIAGRYGSPCGAWAHSEAVNWY